MTRIDSWVIAIDGPAGSGKSSVSREVARRLGFRYADSGSMYRAATLAALRQAIDPADKKALAEMSENMNLEVQAEADPFKVFINGEDVTGAIRGTEIDAAVPQVAQCGAVRDSMTRLQREIARGGGIVIEGRDIGTVVFPDAELKIYLDALPEERARRRGAEIQSESPGRVAAAMRRRDEEDRTRERSPLRPAPDAVCIDTTRLSIEEVVERVMQHVARVGNESRNPRGKGANGGKSG